MPDGTDVTDEELNELKPMPFIAMVSSVGKNDEQDMYNYLDGVKNDKRSEELDAAFKQEKSNFRIVIVVDMWITGVDVLCLTYLYNDKPLKKHLLIQTISRVNRKYPGKEYGMVIDGIVINDKCKNLAIKVKEIIDTKSSFADWLNNQNVRDQLKLEIKICLVKNGYPPQYSPEVFKKVMEQVENFEEYSGETVEKGNNASAKVYQYEMPEGNVMMVAEKATPYGKL